MKEHTNVQRFQTAADVTNFLKSDSGRKLIDDLKRISEVQKSQIEQGILAVRLEEELKTILLLEIENKQDEAAMQLQQEWGEYYAIVVERIATARKEALAQDAGKALEPHVAANASHIAQLERERFELVVQKVQIQSELMHLETKVKEIEDKKEELNSAFVLGEEYYSNIIQPERDAQIAIDPEALRSAMVKVEGESKGLIEQLEKAFLDGDIAQQVKIKDRMNAVNIKMGMLKDLEAVRRGEKYFADKDGKRVTDPKQAQFILNNPISQSQASKLALQYANDNHLLGRERELEIRRAKAREGQIILKKGDNCYLVTRADVARALFEKELKAQHPELDDAGINVQWEALDSDKRNELWQRMLPQGQNDWSALAGRHDDLIALLSDEQLNVAQQRYDNEGQIKMVKELVHGLLDDLSQEAHEARQSITEKKGRLAELTTLIQSKSQSIMKNLRSGSEKGVLLDTPRNEGQSRPGF